MLFSIIVHLMIMLQLGLWVFYNLGFIPTVMIIKLFLFIYISDFQMSSRKFLAKLFWSHNMGLEIESEKSLFLSIK
jgi:hypothetical protein